ncbi:hypothetical protein CASFOL_021852 [Castilleja foliolosa]|uniref:Uncharacterized protein n=1 Tax=Castilleja foliolosa TaxID=1961234 RepID=A0ABD3CXR3_9LAMI
MDTDWTFSSCSWLWEEDSEFKNECVGSQLTNNADKTFEFSNVTLPHYHQSNDNSDHTEKKKTLRGINRGIPWTEEEHRRFLDGLEIYGRGDWKNIAKFSVKTKSNSQVASHAQKYFKRLNSANKDSKRHSINDVTTHDHQVTMPAVLKSTTTGNVPGNNDSALMNALSEIERLMQDDCGGVPITPSSFGIPATPKIQSLVQDDVVPNLSSFEFPCGSDMKQPSVQEIGVMGSGSSGIPAAETVDPEVFILPHFLDID